MKNLDQIRAQHALNASINNNFKGVQDGEVVKKVTTMIRENGFLGAIAFAKEKGGGYKDIFIVMINHFKDKNIGVIDDNVADIDDLISYVCEGESSRLRLITDEAMAYLSYLRRFATKGR